MNTKTGLGRLGRLIRLFLVLKDTGRDFKLNIRAELPACGGRKVPVGGGGMSRCWEAWRKEARELTQELPGKCIGQRLLCKKHTISVVYIRKDVWLTGLEWTEKD